MAARSEKAKSASPPISPGDFPVGSAASRAAARLLLLHREKSVRRLTLIIDVPRPRQDPARPHSSGWHRRADGSLFRCVTVPPGMDVTKALAQLDGLNG
jgi:hypothetical protein